MNTPAVATINNRLNRIRMVQFLAYQRTFALLGFLRFAGKFVFNDVTVHIRHSRQTIHGAVPQLVGLVSVVYLLSPACVHGKFVVLYLASREYGAEPVVFPVAV